MRQKEPIYRIINTLDTTGGNNVKDDTVAEEVVICVLNSTDPVVPYAPPIPYGRHISTDKYSPYAEVKQIACIGAETTKETVVASTVYKLMIGSPQHTNETKKGVLITHSYLSPATLVSAAVDRAQLYTSLVAKINAYTNNYCTAYSLTYAAYTLGTSVGDADTNFIIGETVTQETSTKTARVAKCDITSGTFAADNAAGNIWLFDKSATVAGGWLTTLKKLNAAGHVAGVSTNCEVSVTNATTVEDTGIAIEDDAGYFTSSPNREGKNQIYLNSAFVVDVVEYELAAVYSEGIGSVMYALQPVYDVSKQDVVSGKREYGFQTAPDPTKNYYKYVIRWKGQAHDVNGQMEEFENVLVLYVHDLNTGTQVDEFDAALTAALVK